MSETTAPIGLFDRAIRRITTVRRDMADRVSTEEDQGIAKTPDGMKFLVDLRATLLELTRGDPHLAALEQDMRGLLASWFDVDFLELQRIDWNSPAVLLERLVGYEAVHEIRSWSDLKNRLDSERRCYALFHHRMPNEPLIFVEVALVRGLADSVQRLLDKKAPLLDLKAADTAGKGIRESATLMVNYLYDPANIEEYHEDYASEGKRNASTTVRRLARGWS